jgi:hypothetical protein|tara:strand:- start:1591 stop:1908 length:318 start_codon:yes stop_codon:yes gene_type:complete
MNDKFVYVEKEDADFTSIKVLQKPYNGIIYTYGKIKISEPEDENGNATLSFDWKVEEVPPAIGKSKEELENDEVFSKFIGDILVEILEYSVDYDRSSDDNTSDDN